MGMWDKIIRFIYKKASATSAYEMIDGYVSAPGGRSEEDVRVEAKSLSSGVPGKEKGKVVDKLIAGAKQRREKAAKQRAEGKAELADRTEQQARSLEMAADELNKGLPKADQRPVKIGGGEKPAEEEKTEGGPHTLLRPAVLIPAGVVAVALVGVGVLVASNGGDSGDDFPDEASSPVLDASAPAEAVATGNFTIQGDGVDLSGPFIARVSDSTCAEYAATGESGRYSVPVPGYRDDVEYPFEVYVDLGVADYHGPGTYTGSELGGGVDVIELDGGGPAVRSDGSPSFTVTTQADGSGEASFSGTDQRAQVAGEERTVSGSMTWTCDEVRLDGGYVLAHAQ